VDKLVIDVPFTERVGLSAESSKALAVNECFQRVYPCHQDVDPHVKLIAVDQERVGDILLEDHWFRKYDIF